MRLALAALPVALAAGCAQTPEPPPERPLDPAPQAAEEPAPVERMPHFKNSTLKYLANRNLKPQPTRPLNVSSRCAHRDAIGTQTRLDLLVKEAVVKTFDARVSLQGHGVCRFSLKDFEQVEKLPQALLRHRENPDCQVRMWEQGPQVTIAFNSCPKSCEGQAFDYLWPILVENGSGRCF